MMIPRWLICLFLLVFIFSLYYMCYAYFPSDKAGREKVRRFIFIKGISYIILAFVTIIELVVGSSDLMVPSLTIFIAIMEAVQNIIHVKVEQFNETVKEKQNQSKGDRGFLKESEKLYMYCYDQIVRLENNSSSDLEQLVFETVYDCLKYYGTANNFILVFNNYRKRKCTYADLQRALDEWKEDFQSYGTEIVKNPEYDR